MYTSDVLALIWRLPAAEPFSGREQVATRRPFVNRQRRWFSKRIFNLLVAGLIFPVISIGCVTTDAGVSAGTPEAGIAMLPVAVIKPTLALTPSRTGTGLNPATPAPDEVRVAGSTPVPVNATLSLSMAILAPTQGTALDVGAIRVLGVTLAGAQVTINGIPTEVSSDGSFTRDLIIGEGINSVEAIAKDDSGQEVSESLVLLFVPRTEGVPLSILFPQGLEVGEPNLTIMGATRPDVVVGVNGVPVDINNVGIFSTAVVLEEGTNLIEVVAVDLDENVNFQTVVVFYIP